MSRIGDIAGRIGAVAERPSKVMEFGLGDANPEGQRTIRLWKDLENVRYKGDGIRQDIQVRGGTTGILGSKAQGDIITLAAFSSSYEGVTYNYMIRHTDTRLYLDNLTTLTTTTYGVDVAFKNDTKLQHVVIGRFLYLFDTGAGQAWYIDLKTKDIFEWYSASAKPLYDVDFITDNDFTDKNIWGFGENKSVLVYLSDFSWGTFIFASSDTLAKGIYKYEYGGQKYLTIGGVEYKNDQILILESELPYTIDGTGDDPVLSTPSPLTPLVNGVINFQPQIAKITTLDTDGKLKFKSPWPPMSSDVNIDYYYSVVPSGVDINAFLESSGKYSVGTADITVNSDFNEPTLYRAYCVVYELNDGSFTHPSVPIEISTPASSIFEDVGVDPTQDLRTYRKGVQLRHIYNTAPNNLVPDNAVKGYLFSTRWQLKSNDCYGTRPDYPNGSFYFARDFSVTDFTIDDYTPDEELIDHISAFVPHTAGRPTILPASSIKPHHVSGVKGSILFGGYELNKPVPDPNVNYRIETSGTVDADKHLSIVYEYSDNTFSDTDYELELKTTENIYKQKALSSLVLAVYLYLKDTSSGTDYYLIKKVTPKDPEFFGKEIVISTDPADYTLDALPDTNTDEEVLDLANYIALATPGQMIDITSQKPISNVERIERLFADMIDNQRGDRLRYLIYLLTNKEPVIVYLGADLSSGAFDVNEEPVAESLPLLAPFSCALWGDRVVFQSHDGLYVWRGKDVERIIDNTRYSFFDSPFKDAAYHAREHELWLLGANNQVLVLSDSLSTSREEGLLSYLMKYDAADMWSFNSISHLGNQLYGGFDHRIATLDISGTYNDDDVCDATAEVSGLLTTDYLSSTAVQLYMEVIELIGEGVDVTVYLDLQDSRFDDGGAWSAAFTADMTTDEVTLSMKGLFVELYRRGLQPRIRLKVVPNTGNRLSAARLFYRPIEHEGASRF